MVQSDAMSEMKLPTITEADLSNFHATHFANAPRPQMYFAQPQEPAFQQEQEEQDDGLGWYSDGAKRTLTDDQIEIFRHSELMKLEREQRLPEKEFANVKSTNKRSQSTSTSADRYETKDAQATQNKFAVKTSSRQPKPQIPYDQRHKRKWEGYVDEQDPLHGSMTHRRLARELDEQVADNVQVDYGDDPVLAEVRPVVQRVNESQRRVISYAED